MLDVPDITSLQAAFGEVKHLPPMHAIPAEFKNSDNPHVAFISEWFFGNLSNGGFVRLKERDGVDRTKALRAISAILRSREPKHEHKEAGAGYLLFKWFTLEKKG